MLFYKANETEDNFSFASLLSDFKDPNKADFVIKKKGSETRIYLDETTKTELLINSMLISFHGITNKQECLEIEENKS